MARALIIDTDRRRAMEIAGALRIIGCRGVVRTSISEAIDLLSLEPVDVLIVSEGQSTCWQNAVMALLSILQELPNRPQIFSILRGPYRGPADRLWGARRGVRVIYEQN